MYVATNPSYRLMVSATHLLYEPIVSRRSSGSYRCPSSELKRALVYNHLRARCTWSNFTVMAARLSIQNFVVCLSLHTVSGGGDEMTNDADRKTYWDLLETLRWIGTRDEQLVAAMWDWNDDKKMAVVLFGMKEQRGIRSLPGPSGSNRGVDLDPAAPQGDEKRSIRVLDEVLRKVQSGRVRMTAIKCDGSSEEQTPVPLVELNGLRLQLVPGHPVASVGLWSRSHNSLVWKWPQFLSGDVVGAWPAPNAKTAAVSGAILRHLREIMSPEAPLSRAEALKRCQAEVPNAYPAAFKKAWADLEPGCKRGRGKHGPRGH